MRFMTMLALVLAAPAGADPLGLNDYAMLFEQGEPASDVVGDNVSAVRIGDIAIVRRTDDEVTYTGIDQSGHGAVGCFVNILATLEGAQRACDITLTPEQLATQDSYRRVALIFYGRNVQPPTTLETVHARYAALVASEVEAVKPFCDAPEEFIDFANRLFAPEALAEFEGMMSVPRLPVTSPCL